MLTELNIKDFLEKLGSKEPTPGGGSASALAGALAAALAGMVANLSGEEQAAAVPQARVLTEDLLGLADRDAQAFDQVMAAYRMPRKTEQEKKIRSEAVQEATKSAIEVPLEIMETSLRALVLAKEMALHGNPNTVSDAGVAGLLGAAACKGASYNVLINLAGLKDAAFAVEAKARLGRMLREAEEMGRIIAEHTASVLT